MMIIFRSEHSAFNYRIVGVALHEGRVLLHKGESEDFWTLPGGRAEIGEPATETLKREMREELEVEVEIERLLWVVENFFTYLGTSWHELALYFLMSFPHDSDLLKRTSRFYGYEIVEPEVITLIFEWHSLDALDSVTLLPSFLKQGLRALPERTEHVVHTDPPN
jgi:ADP-ribose pyrophosphatase YjhB (NUDIX family)